jgi:hypothetical protein
MNAGKEIGRDAVARDAEGESSSDGVNLSGRQDSGGTGL